MKRLGIKSPLVIGAGLIALLGVAFLATPLQADIIVWELDWEYTGATPPEGLLTITLDDGDTTGSVDLTVDATGLVDSEWVNIVLLNLDPEIDPATLTITESTSPPYSPVIGQGVNAFQAAGDGYFDIKLDFENATSGNRLDNDPGLAEFTITGEGISLYSFLFESAPGGGHGPFYVAAHIGGIGPDDQDSGWVTDPVPEASTLMLMGMGLPGLALWARSRRRKVL